MEVNGTFAIEVDSRKGAAFERALVRVFKKYNNDLEWSLDVNMIGACLGPASLTQTGARLGQGSSTLASVPTGSASLTPRGEL